MNRDWKDLSNTWQQQPVPGLDIDALRSEAQRRGRTLRWVLWGEVALTALMVVLFVFVLLAQDSDVFEEILFGALVVFLVGYQTIMTRRRLREVDSAGLDPPALLALEIRRCRTTLWYWRVGTWTAMALWLVLYAVMFVGMQQDWPLGRVAGLAGGLGMNVFLFPLMCLYGLRSCNSARKRLKRFLALREQLGAP